MLPNFDEKGQFTNDVGNIVALLIVIAIGALVLYSITGVVETGGTSVAIDNEGSKTFSIDQSVYDAPLSTEYDFSASTTLTVTLNGENVIQSSVDGTGTLDEKVGDSVNDSNTLEVSVDNADHINSINTTLDVNTQSGHVIGNVESKGGTAFNLMTILAIVVVAAVIIGVVMRAIGGMGQQQAAPAPAR